MYVTIAVKRIGNENERVENRNEWRRDAGGNMLAPSLSCTVFVQVHLCALSVAVAAVAGIIVQLVFRKCLHANQPDHNSQPRSLC